VRKSSHKLGEILIQAGLITEGELGQALKQQKTEKGRLGETLIRLGLVSEDDIVDALGKQLGIPYIKINHSVIEPALSLNLKNVVPEEFARTNDVIPLSRTYSTLTCAFVDPLDLMVIDNLHQLTQCEINPVISTRRDIENALNELYGAQDLLKDAVSSSFEEGGGVETISSKPEEQPLEQIIKRAGEAPVVKLVDLILLQAVKDRASDIHIEPFGNRIIVRFRIDGILYEIPPPSSHFLTAITSRIKILSKLDIAEKRLPQDGSFSIKVENRLIDLRVSTVPAIHGEKVLVRLLDKESVPSELQDIGFAARHFTLMENVIMQPFGLVLITGPTGCGKTTTLYSTLRRVVTSEKNIMSVEDPVEYKLEGVNQVQIKPQIGLTFSTALRAFLRQDPDIIMVGEVRDLETAEICVKASLTGHLVFSTLHTSDATSAIVRLIDIGVKPFLVANALSLVISQRLVRKLCEKCKEIYQPSQEIVDRLQLGDHKIFRPGGCGDCRKLGYRGRVPLYEMFLPTPELKNLVGENPSSDVLRSAARKAGMQTIWECGIERVKEGWTTLEEVSAATVGNI
jgi:type IV pilus assembly protein PilB